MAPGGDDDNGNLPALTANDLALLEDDYAAFVDEAGTLDEPRPSGSAADAELAEIRALRQTDPRRYWSDDIQAREAELLAQKANPGDGLDPDLIAEWESAGGIELNRDNALVTARTALDQATDAEELQATFDQLPPKAQTAIFRELALEPDIVRKPAGVAEIQRFAETAEGQELVDEWADDAGHKLAVLKTRMARIIDAMSNDERAEAEQMLDELPTADVKAIYKALTGDKRR